MQFPLSPWGSLYHCMGSFDPCKVWVLWQPENLQRKKGETLLSRLIYGAWTYDLDSYLPAFALHPPKTWLVGGMPFSLTVYVLRVVYLKPCNFHEVISWNLAKYFVQMLPLAWEENRIKNSVLGLMHSWACVGADTWKSIQLCLFSN